MKYTITLLATLLIAGSTIVGAAAMGQETAKERAANLRAQLLQVQSQQEQLQNRLSQLDEDLKPENIEKVLAGVGSTRPEDLREQRRRQLEIEKTGVQARLNILATSRTRLETRLAQADNDAYHESAGVNPNGTPRSTGPGPSVNADGSPIVARPRTPNSGIVATSIPPRRRRARAARSKSVRHRTRRVNRAVARP
jgi:hypothetical protein